MTEAFDLRLMQKSKYATTLIRVEIRTNALENLYLEHYQQTSARYLHQCTELKEFLCRDLGLCDLVNVCKQFLKGDNKNFGARLKWAI